ncbi:MAG TPA: ABC transporter ATP-binding protein [Candidatus Azoamicus sp. MARI]
MIKIENLKKKFKHVIALNDVSFSVEKGSFFSILGKNGAGKSTTIGIIMSLIKKDSGKIFIKNYDMDKDVSIIKTLIGFMPQEYNFNQFETVIDIITNQAGFYGIKKSDAIKHADVLLKKFDLWNFKFSISMNLSGGLKRRLMLIRSLIHKPEILILDEPTAGVDIISRRLIWDYLKEINFNGTTIILTSHYLEEIEKLCTDVAIIDKGSIILKTTVSNLINKINNKIFILELEEEGGKKKQIEILLNKNDNLNNELNLLIKNNILIKNIKNKTNDLEELFITLTN